MISSHDVGEGSNGLSSITDHDVDHDLLIPHWPAFFGSQGFSDGWRNLHDQAFNYATFRWLDVASGCHQMGLRRKERPTIPSGPPARRP